MKMKCPFCHAGITFDKSIAGEVENCPTCEHPVKLKPSTCWGELKGDFKLLGKSIEDTITKVVKCVIIPEVVFPIVGLLIFALIVLVIVLWWKIILTSLMVIGVLWGLARIPTPSKYPCPAVPHKNPTPPNFQPHTVNHITNNYSNCYNNYSSKVDRIKCDYCGTKRPASVSNCPSCGGH